MLWAMSKVTEAWRFGAPYKRVGAFATFPCVDYYR